MLAYCCRVLRYYCNLGGFAAYGRREKKIAAKAVERRCALRSSRLARKQNIDRNVRLVNGQHALHSYSWLLSHLATSYLAPMSPRPKAYPRATLKKILKGHTNRNIGRGVDHLVCTIPRKCFLSTHAYFER